MRTRLLLTAVMAFALSGCVIHDHNNVPPPGTPGNVNFVWSFGDGNTCSTLVNEVDHMEISIPGEALANGGVFGCQSAGHQGIQLQDFAAGGYSFSITAVGFGGQALYTASGSFTVNGDVTVSTILQPVASPGNVNLLWSFSDNNSCADLAAFVDHMQVSVDGEVLANNGVYPCSAAGTQGVQLQDFAPGTYALTVSAVSQSGVVYYTASTNFTVNGDVTVPVVLAPVNNQQPGNLIVYWTFPNSMSCSSAGVANVVVNIPGEQLQNGGVFPCSTAGVQGIQLNNFAPRSYTVNVSATDSNGVPLYQGTSNVNVNGDTQTTVALAATQSTSATLQLRWSFLDANNLQHTCAQAGVNYVQVTLGNFAPITVACSANGVDGADFNNMASGSYTVDLQGLPDSNSGTQATFSYNQTIVVTSPTTLANVQLTPLFGSWDLTYNFSNAASCSVAGVSSVSLSVHDSSGNEISGTNGQHYSCADAPNNVFSWTSFPGGNLTIQMFGYDSGGNTIRGATRSTTLMNGGANATTVTLDTCGTANSGC